MSEEKSRLRRWQLEQIISEYITEKDTRLEDYSGVEICCEADRQEALQLMKKRLWETDVFELRSFAKAIETGAVRYSKYVYRQDDCSTGVNDKKKKPSLDVVINSCEKVSKSQPVNDSINQSKENFEL